MLTQGDTWGNVERGVDEEVQTTEMVGVEHLGQYVFEMTKARMGVDGPGLQVDGMDVGDDGIGEVMDEDGEEDTGMELVVEGGEEVDVVE